MVVLLSSKYIQSNNLFWKWRDDHWVDPWTQWTSGELDLGEDSVYDLNSICPDSKWHTPVIFLSLSINVNLDLVSHVLRVFVYTPFPSVWSPGKQL